MANPVTPQKPNFSYSKISYPEVVETSYEAWPFKLPEDFLAPLEDPSRIKVEWIDFSKELPGYKDFKAAVIDHVLTPEECQQLIHYAEMSAGLHLSGGEAVDTDQSTGTVDPLATHRPGQGAPGRRGWQPAMVSAGFNSEFAMNDYRNSDRIIWDEKEVTKRLWKRLRQVPGLESSLAEFKGDAYHKLGGISDKFTAQLTDYGLNDRMRFLRYGKGQFFKPHADSRMTLPNGDTSYFTMHLYLNDSAEVLPKGEIGPDMLHGGSTPFLSPNHKKRLDVFPKAGRVLLFQQSRLVHCGDVVKAGVKHTMRTELMYRKVPIEDTNREKENEKK